MRYLLTLSLAVLVSVISIAALNWIVDPAGIFRKTTFGQQFANALTGSEYGLLFPPSLDEREFKTELAKRATQYDCVVVGSSRVMQIGSSRKHRSLPGCESILNLGVSGAVIQDHVTLTWLALLEGKPRMLFLGIDPWTFAMGNDERWKIRYAETYPIARKEIDEAQYGYSTSSNRWSNLVSAQYTQRSIDRLVGGSFNRKIDFAQSVDEDMGGKFSVILPDGSLIYSAEKIADAKNSRVPFGGGSYKTDGLINDLRAIDLYRRLVIWAKERGVKPVLLMTPYHPNVWMIEASPNVKAMVTTELFVREIGGELGISVIGSFRPELAGCLPGEFYDFMHPMASCLARFMAKENVE
jgi:hypothetical protein